MSASDDLSFDQLMELDRRAAAREVAAADADGENATGGSDGVVVLPWWQHPVNIVTLVVTAALMAAMIGWMAGDSGAQVRHNDIDTGFLQDMREHHEQAVQMSFIFRTRPDTDPGLQTIARSIIVGQNIEVGRFIQLLRSFGEAEARELEVPMLWMGMAAEPGQMPGMATEDELLALGEAEGREADELFVRLMVEHHIGGVEMAEFAAENGENDQVVRMATSMAQAQRGEIDEMVAQLSDDPGET